MVLYDGPSMDTIPDVAARLAPFLAAALRRERGEKGWSVIEWARRADVDRSHLAEILDEKRAPTVEMLEKLTEAIGLPLSGLFLEAERLRDAKR